jgi:hypothetical protein
VALALIYQMFFKVLGWLVLQVVEFWRAVGSRSSDEAEPRRPPAVLRITRNPPTVNLVLTEYIRARHKTHHAQQAPYR